MAYDAKVDSARMNISLEGSMVRENSDATQGYAAEKTDVFSTAKLSSFRGPATTLAVADNDLNVANFIDTAKLTIADGAKITLNLNLWAFTTEAGCTVQTGGGALAASASGENALKGPLGQTISSFTVLKGIVIKSTADDAVTLTVDAADAIPDIFPTIGDSILLKGGCAFGFDANFLEDTGSATTNGITIATGAGNSQITFTAGGGGIVTAEVTVIGWTS